VKHLLPAQPAFGAGRVLGEYKGAEPRFNNITVARQKTNCLALWRAHGVLIQL